MALDCVGKRLLVGDEVVAERNNDGVPVGVRGVVQRVQERGRVQVEFRMGDVLSVRSVQGSVIRKKKSS